MPFNGNYSTLQGDNDELINGFPSMDENTKIEAQSWTLIIFVSVLTLFFLCVVCGMFVLQIEKNSPNHHLVSQ